MVRVESLVSFGDGLTVTVTVFEAPTQFGNEAEVGVTIYSTDPELTKDGLTNCWLMLVSAVDVPRAVCPVMLPVLVPRVHAKVLGMVADKGVLVKL